MPSKIIHTQQSLQDSAKRRLGEAHARVRRARQVKNATYAITIGVICALAFILFLLLRNPL